MRIVSKAPCRVDLAGGTLDIWPLYLYHPNAVTLNFAIDRYATCVLETRRDSRIRLRSLDQGREETFSSIRALVSSKHYKLPLIAQVVKFFAPEMGIDLVTDSEAPAGAGLAGSSTLIIAVASALNRLTGAGYGLEKLREIAQNIEAQIIRVPTGAQDYYPAMYGGVSAIELSAAGVARKALTIDLARLNERFVLAYTGAPRNSGINNWKVTKAYIDGDRGVWRNFNRIASIASTMRQTLERADWNGTGRLLRKEWENRRKNAPRISTPLIDRLIAAATPAGGIGAKACGAGGGGCVVFLVEPGSKRAVAEVIEREGARVLPVKAAARGVQVRVSG